MDISTPQTAMLSSRVAASSKTYSGSHASFAPSKCHVISNLTTTEQHAHAARGVAAFEQTPNSSVDVYATFARSGGVQPLNVGPMCKGKDGSVVPPATSSVFFATLVQHTWIEAVLKAACCSDRLIGPARGCSKGCTVPLQEEGLQLPFF